MELNLNGKKVNELKKMCLEKGIKGYSKKKKQELIEMLSRPLDESLEVKFEKVDKYSQQILIQRYNMFIEWHKKTQEIIDTTGLPIRHQNLSEDI